MEQGWCTHCVAPASVDNAVQNQDRVRRSLAGVAAGSEPAAEVAAGSEPAAEVAAGSEPAAEVAAGSEPAAEVAVK